MPALPRGSRELTIAEIVALTDATPPSGEWPARRISNIAPLDMAGPRDVSFLDDGGQLAKLAHTHAGACLLEPRFAASAPAHVVALRTAEPYRAFVTVARALFSSALRPSSLFEEKGRGAGTHVHPSARLEAGIVIDPLAVVGPRAEIGSGSLVGAGAVIGPDVCIGRHCAIGAGATIAHALIGDHVVFHAGVRVGQDVSRAGTAPAGAEKLPHTRRVIVQDGAEIGANVTIDRGTTRDTMVGEATRIDNLAYIAHNVSIGRHCLIGAQASLGAEAKLGDFVTIGDQVRLAEGIFVGDHAVVAAVARVSSDVAKE